MFVAAGRGELRTDDGVIPFAKGDAIFIPAGEWHWLINTGAEDLVSVFSFPRPDRPPTQTRSVRASGTA
jgi:quercetin dioxygenase-like cupin family protein